MHVTTRLIPFATGLTTPQRGLARAGLVVFLLVGGMQALYGPALPSVRTSFGVNTATAGWVVGAHAFGSVAGVLLSLVMETRVQPRNRLMAGLGLMGAGAAGFAIIPVWPWALLGILCIGVGYGILVVVVNAQFAAGFGDRSAALLILVNAGFGLGAVIGPLLFGLLSSGNFRPAFLAAGALAVVLLPLGWRVPEISMQQRDAVAPAGHSAPLALGGFMSLFLLYTALESDTSGWMATHLIFHGFSQAAAAELTAAFWTALTVGRLVSVPISLRITPVRIISGSLSGVAILALAAHFSALIPVAYILIGLLLAPIFPVGVAWMVQAPLGRRGTTSMALLGALGGALIFPVFVGRVMGASTPDALPLALLIIAVLCLVVSLGLPRLICAARVNAGVDREGAKTRDRTAS